jgi:glutamate synthase (NADPH/NADH) small chain
MGKVTGFLEIDRQERKYAPAADRVRHYNEFIIPLSKVTRNRATRCMDYGIPIATMVSGQQPDSGLE